MVLRIYTSLIENLEAKKVGINYSRFKWKHKAEVTFMVNFEGELKMKTKTVTGYGRTKAESLADFYEMVEFNKSKHIINTIGATEEVQAVS